MRAQFTLRLTMLAFAAALASCGGGGGGGGGAADTSSPPPTGTTPTNPVTPPSSGTPTTPVTPPVASGPVKVSLSGLDVKRTDLLATTKAVSGTASIFNALKGFAFKVMPSGTAFAAGLPKLDVGSNIGFTNKLVDGKIVALNAQLTPVNGTLPCDTSNAEVKVNKIWALDAQGNLLANVYAPDTIDAVTCKVNYRTADYVITSQGAVIENTTAGTEQLTDVVSAGDEGFNTSPNALLIYNSGIICELKITDPATGASTVTDLFSSAAAVNTQIGQFAYDGSTLVGVSSDRYTNALLVYTKGAMGFKIIRPNDLIGEPNKYYGVFVNDQGKFMLNTVSTGMHEIFTSTATLGDQIKAPRPTSGATYDWVTKGTDGTTTATNLALMQWYMVEGWGSYMQARDWADRPSYGAMGRSGKVVMSDRCELWNYENGAVTYLQKITSPKYDASYAYTSRGYAYARLAGGMAYCATGGLNEYSRLDLTTNTAVGFKTDNIDGSAWLPKSFQMFRDYVMLVGVNSTSEDVEYLELNFNTGKATVRGVISSGSRKVVDLIPIGG